MAMVTPANYPAPGSAYYTRANGVLRHKFPQHQPQNDSCNPSQEEVPSVALAVSKTLFGGLLVGGFNALVLGVPIAAAILTDMGIGLLEAWGVDIARKQGTELPLKPLSALASMITALATGLLFKTRRGAKNPLLMALSVTGSGLLGYLEGDIAERGMALYNRLTLDKPKQQPKQNPLYHLSRGQANYRLASPQP